MRPRLRPGKSNVIMTNIAYIYFAMAAGTLLNDFVIGTLQFSNEVQILLQL